MTAFGLKLLALFTMTADHIGAIFFPQEQWIRIIGRMSFPIYCFLLAEGLKHTRSVVNYALRLGIFAVLSEPAYDLAFSHTLWEPSRQNVFFTLLLGFLAGELLLKKGGENPVLSTMLAILCAVLAEALHADYGAMGVCFILCFALISKRAAACAAFALMNTADSLMWGGVQLYAPAAVIPILLYNGKKGRSFPKYAFYAFYPIHLFLLSILFHFIR